MRNKFKRVVSIGVLLLPLCSISSPSSWSEQPLKVQKSTPSITTKPIAPSSKSSKNSTNNKKESVRTFTQNPWTLKPTQSNSFYKPSKKAASDLDINTNKITTKTTDKINIFGEIFKLPDVASSTQIIEMLRKELKCEVINDPSAFNIFPIYGNIKEDTLGMCRDGDPADDGYIFYVSTSKEAIKLFNSTSRPKITSPYKNTYSYSSMKAVIMVAGGSYAFDAEEISYDILSVLGYEPERIKLG